MLLLSCSVSDTFKDICLLFCLFILKGWFLWCALIINTASNIHLYLTAWCCFARLPPQRFSGSPGNWDACCMPSSFYWSLQGEVPTHTRKTTGQGLPSRGIHSSVGLWIGSPQWRALCRLARESKPPFSELACAAAWLRHGVKLVKALEKMVRCVSLFIKIG